MTFFRRGKLKAISERRHFNNKCLCGQSYKIYCVIHCKIETNKLLKVLPLFYYFENERESKRERESERESEIHINKKMFN